MWHAAKGKHETGEQDRREKNKERHLHCLQLVFRDRGKRYAHGEVRDNEDEGDPQEKQDASLHGHLKEKVRRDQNDRDLDVAD